MSSWPSASATAVSTRKIGAPSDTGTVAPRITLQNDDVIRSGFS
jgi:hypothetical protein